MAGTLQTLDVRADFPMLARQIDGRPIVYLDSAATSQKPSAVLDAMDDLYRSHNASVHRGVYTLGREATEAFEGARERIAAFVGWDTASTIFTANATAAINLVAYSWARHNLGPGDAILLTTMEHHSNIVPWQLVAAETGARVRYVKVTDDGFLDLEHLDAELARGDVKLVGVVHVSNVLGTVNPVVDIVERAHGAGALTLIDGSQAVPQLPVDLAAIGSDFYAWTGHKALGPTGIGVLHARRDLLDAMPPFISGGHMIREVRADSSTWNDVPWKFEAGTSNIAEAVGLGAAVEYLDQLGMANVRRHELALARYALERLGELPFVTIMGPAAAEDRGGVISFEVDGIHPHDVAELLDRDNVCVRAGHHCAQPLMRRMCVAATARASFGPYNVPSDVDALVESLRGAREIFELA